MSRTFLESIISVTSEKVAAHRNTVDISAVRDEAFAIRKVEVAHRLLSAMSRDDRTNIIAEIKRASPSKGIINDKIDVAETARMYEQGGATAISVLTEEAFFQGSLDDLRMARRAVDLPILRKDFMIDEYQIFEAAAAGADAILLIVAVLSEESLGSFFTLSNDLGMDALIEVHTVDELETAFRVGARMIGVNNRDLRTFEVSLDVSRELIGHRQDNVLMIAESGISSRKQIDELRSLGFDGFLVGESLMRSASPEKLKELAL